MEKLKKKYCENNGSNFFINCPVNKASSTISAVIKNEVPISLIFFRAVLNF